MEVDLIRIELPEKDKVVTLIPTAHVSKNSAEMAAEAIDEIKPDAICIELDEDRYNSLSDPEKYRNTNLSQIIKDKKVSFMLVNLILGNYQKKISKQLGTSSGGEMLVGIQKAKEYNCELVLADRKIQTTFKRIWASLSGKDKIRLIYLIISSLFDDEEITEEDLLKIQQEDQLMAALGEVSKEFPGLSEALVTERDMYIANKIRNAPGKNVVAILGAAHTIGVQQYIHEDYDITQFDEIPPKKPIGKILKWAFPVLILAIIIHSFTIDPDTGWKQIKTWILLNGTLSALGVVIAGGTILSILVAFLAAPLTSLNPLLAAGWFAGLTEAHFRNPTVADFDNLSEDLNSLKGIWHNRVTKVLLVVIFANLGSTIGTIISSLNIFSSLFN